MTGNCSLAADLHAYQYVTERLAGPWARSDCSDQERRRCTKLVVRFGSCDNARSSAARARSQADAELMLHPVGVALCGLEVAFGVSKAQLPALFEPGCLEPGPQSLDPRIKGSARQDHADSLRLQLLRRDGEYRRKEQSSVRINLAAVLIRSPRPPGED
jgi:hypothetical protein